MRGCVVVMKLPTTSCPELQPSESSNGFCGGMFKLNAKCDADSLLYSLSHFECHVHTVHMLTQLHLPPPLVSTVKLSLFTLVHSSSVSLAARLPQCHVNDFHYINNGWVFFFFFGQTSVFFHFFLSCIHSIYYFPGVVEIITSIII